MDLRGRRFHLSCCCWSAGRKTGKLVPRTSHTLDALERSADDGSCIFNSQMQFSRLSPGNCKVPSGTLTQTQREQPRPAETSRPCLNLVNLGLWQVRSANRRVKFITVCVTFITVCVCVTFITVCDKNCAANFWWGPISSPRRSCLAA